MARMKEIWTDFEENIDFMEGFLEDIEDDELISFHPDWIRMLVKNMKAVKAIVEGE